jgi:glutaredoxin 3
VVTERRRVVLYTTQWCGYCERARRLFRQKGIEFEEIDVEGSAEARREMMQRSGRRSVPQIFIDGTYVGGSDDLLDLEGSGRLDALLNAQP